MLKGLTLNYGGTDKVRHIIKRLMIDIRQAQENLKWFVFPVEETAICDGKKENIRNGDIVLRFLVME